MRLYCSLHMRFSQLAAARHVGPCLYALVVRQVKWTLITVCTLICLYAHHHTTHGQSNSAVLQVSLMNARTVRVRNSLSSPSSGLLGSPAR